MKSLILLVVAASVAVAGGGKRPPRRLAVEFQVEHASQCVECPGRIADVLRSQPGVLHAHAIKERRSAVVVFEDGGADPEEMKKVLAKAGIVARLIWGPAAVEADGSFERTPIDRFPRQTPTLKESEAKAQAPLKSGFTPPEQENVPVPTE